MKLQPTILDLYYDEITAIIGYLASLAAFVVLNALAEIDGNIMVGQIAMTIIAVVVFIGIVALVWMVTKSNFET